MAASGSSSAVPQMRSLPQQRCVTIDCSRAAARTSADTVRVSASQSATRRRRHDASAFVADCV